MDFPLGNPGDLSYFIYYIYIYTVLYYIYISVCVCAMVKSLFLCFVGHPSHPGIPQKGT